MAQLLIELFSEEIPARMQVQAAADFKKLFDDKLFMAGFNSPKFPAQLGLGHYEIKSFAGPRRLTLVVENLQTSTLSNSELVKGPKETAPPQAIEGFRRKIVSITGDESWFTNELPIVDGSFQVMAQKPVRDTTEVLSEILREVIFNFPWPKSMRSGTSTFRWVRPLKRILFLFDGKVVPFELEGLTASNVTEGHRFNGNDHEPFEVADFEDYRKQLAFHFVVLDSAERRQWILNVATQQCQIDKQLEFIPDEGLADEVAGLVEDPVPLIGDMDPIFLTLPPEVIRTSMRTHQKYFAVRDPKTGKLAPNFVVVANTRTNDNGAEIKRGNAKVLSARLSDAVFFWKEDNRQGNFDQWLTKLNGVTFHAKLGTMAQRVARIEALAKDIAPFVHADPAVAGEAARLAKADLASYMVGEFPELQGVMGGYYADAAGLKPEVANAIREHYKPQGPSDSVPEAAVSAAVALADKIDTLIGFFAIDEKPTGSKDPFALRRSALGILRILRQHNVRVSLNELASFWYKSLLIYAGAGRAVYVDTDNWRGSAGPRIAEGDGEIFDNYLRDFKQGLLESPVWVIPTDRDYDLDVLYEHVPNVADVENALLAFRSYTSVASEFEDFMADRLKVQLKDEGHRFDIIEAVFALKDDDIVRQTLRIAALETMLKTPQGDNLLAVHKRAANILAAEAKKGDLPSGEPKAMPGAPSVEAALLTQLNTARRAVGTALEAEKYIDALHLIAAMRQGVDAFLDGVLVNADDAAVRSNRLMILKAVCDLSGDIADLSKIA